MSVARHHAEWLPLLEVSGAFLVQASPQYSQVPKPDRGYSLVAAQGLDCGPLLGRVKGFAGAVDGAGPGSGGCNWPWTMVPSGC